MSTAMSWQDRAAARQSLLAIYEDVADAYSRPEVEDQPPSPFRFLDEPAKVEPIAPRQEPWDKSTMLAFEREMLGLYVSDHPLIGNEHLLGRPQDTEIAAITSEDSEVEDGATVTIVGLVTGLSAQRSKKSGRMWAKLEIEDLTGAIECLFFGDEYESSKDLFEKDRIVNVRGNVNRQDDGAVSMYARSLWLVDGR